MDTRLPHRNSRGKRFSGETEVAAGTPWPLSAEGVDVPVAGPLATLRDATGELLTRGQRVGAIRPEIRLDEVMALLGSICQGALTGGWDHDLRRRTPDIVFAGLRTGSSSPST